MILRGETLGNVCLVFIILRPTHLFPGLILLCIFVVINLSRDYDSVLRSMNPSSENRQTHELSWGFLLLTSQTSHWKNNTAVIRKCYLHLVEQRRDSQRLAKCGSLSHLPSFL